MNKNVLIIDDEPDICRIMELIIQKNGYNALVAESGNKAIELARENEFSLIFLDYFLPDINGSEVLVSIRALPNHLNDHIVMMSASEDKIHQLPDMPNATKVVKPLEVDQIFELLQKYAKRD